MPGLFRRGGPEASERQVCNGTGLDNWGSSTVVLHLWIQLVLQSTGWVESRDSLVVITVIVTQAGEARRLCVHIIRVIAEKAAAWVFMQIPASRAERRGWLHTGGEGKPGRQRRWEPTGRERAGGAMGETRGERGRIEEEG